ncbi:MAG: hypothetical protein WCE54_24150, partial [Ignavibacteriaceae bacterium]
MMSKPAEIDLDEIKKLVEDINKVKNIHHSHLWKLNDTDMHWLLLLEEVYHLEYAGSHFGQMISAAL